MLTLDRERRTEPRVSLTRPCKVYDPRARDYLPGTTCNASREGLLLRLQRTSNLQVGDRVFVGIAAKRRQALLHSSEMLEATVVRVLRPDMGETVMAVRWATESRVLSLPYRDAA